MTALFIAFRSNMTSKLFLHMDQGIEYDMILRKYDIKFVHKIKVNSHDLTIDHNFEFDDYDNFERGKILFLNGEIIYKNKYADEKNNI